MIKKERDEALPRCRWHLNIEKNYVVKICYWFYCNLCKGYYICVAGAYRVSVLGIDINDQSINTARNLQRDCTLFSMSTKLRG